MRWRKPLVWIAGLLGALLLCIAAVVLSAPLWIDAASIKARVSEIIASTTNGNAQFEQIDLNFLPVPRITVTRFRYSLPGVLDLEAESASVELDLPALFTAKIQPGTLHVARPQVTVQIPDPEQDNESSSMESLEESLRGVLAQIRSLAPAIEVAIDDGSVLIQKRGRQQLSLDELRLRAETEDGRIDATMSCRSNLWDRITLEIGVIDDELTGHGSAEVVGLQMQDIGKILGEPEQWPIRNGVVDGNLDWKLKGLTNIDAHGSLSSAAISLQFDERHLDLIRPTIDASVQLHNGVTEFSIRQLALDQPRLDAKAKLTQSAQGGITLEAQITNANLSHVQAAAARLVPEIDILALPPLQFEQGVITSARVQSAAATYPGLLEPTTVQAQIEIADVDALVPDYDLRIGNFGANASLEAGRLNVNGISGHIGQSMLRDGTFSATLSDKFIAERADLIAQDADHVLRGIEMAALINEHISFNAGATLSLDLAENLAIAKRLVSDGDIRRELDRIRALAGRADVHATAKVTRQQPDIHLELSSIELTARHAAAPFQIPVRIERGAVRYVNDAVHAQGLSGTIGHTTFRDIGARVGIRTPYALTAGTGSARLALDQLMLWAKALPELSKHLDGIDKIEGAVSVSASMLEGPLLSPEKLQYELSASPNKVSIDAPRYGPRVDANGGVIDISNARIRIRNINVSSLDASLRMSGETKSYRNGLNAVKAKVDGTVGLQSLEWVRERAGMPENLRFRNSLKLSGVNALWQRDGTYAAQGNIQVTDGLAIDIAMRGSPDHIEVEKLSVQDAFSNADLEGKLEGTRYAVRFKGKLAGQSFAHLFVEPPLQFGELDGDLRAKSDWKNPGGGEIEGELNAKMIKVPATLIPDIPMPVTVEALSLSGHAGKVLFNAFTVAAGDSRLDVTGSIEASGKQYQLDLDVRGDKVIIPRPTAKPLPSTDTARDPTSDAEGQTKSALEKATESGERQFTTVETILQEIPVSGKVDVNIRQLTIGALEMKPFVATASMGNQRLDLKLQQARLCNILLTGGFTAVARGKVGVNISMRSRDARIERSIRCLTNQGVQLTGSMDVDASFAAAGTGDEFLKSAHATFTVTARDGEIQKFIALGKVFNAVNATKAGGGKLPDINNSDLQYKIISVKGYANLQSAHFEEIVLDINVAKIVAQGDVEYDTQKINATVLVAPLKTIDKIISWMPFLGRIFGSTALAIPIGVSGTIQSPVVVPLSPTAVAGRVLNIFTNTLKLPTELVNDASSSAKETDSSADPINSSP